MVRDKKFYWTLFSSTFVISAFTVGGGAVIIPLLQKKFVDELGWIEESEMLDMVAIAQSAPGVMAANASIIIGYRLAGVPGALLTVLGTIIPPLITLSIISFFYLQFASNHIVALALKGMQAGVVAVMCNVTWKMYNTTMKKKSVITLPLLIGALLSVLLLDINVIIVILICGIIGGVYTFLQQKKQKKEGEAK